MISHGIYVRASGHFFCGEPTFIKMLLSCGVIVILANHKDIALKSWYLMGSTLPLKNWFLHLWYVPSHMVALKAPIPLPLCSPNSLKYNNYDKAEYIVSFYPR